jgi:hypothetical protein
MSGMSGKSHHAGPPGCKQSTISRPRQEWYGNSVRSAAFHQYPLIQGVSEPAAADTGEVQQPTTYPQAGHA